MVRVQLKDGMVFDCDVYENDCIGQLPINDREKIDKLFINKGYVYFNTLTISGKFHSSSVVNYEILNC